MLRRVQSSVAPKRAQKGFEIEGMISDRYLLQKGNLMQELIIPEVYIYGMGSRGIYF